MDFRENTETRQNRFYICWGGGYGGEKIRTEFFFFFDQHFSDLNFQKQNKRVAFLYYFPPKDILREKT